MNDEDHLPWSSAAGSLRSSFVSPGVVLTDSPLRVDGEADVDATLEFRVCAVEHVHPKEALHLHHHGKRISRCL